MLNRIAAVSAFAIGIAGAAYADMAELDTDGDGLVSFEEMLVAVPAVTEETFTSLDTNADGALDSDEYAAAEEAGTLPVESDG